MEQAINMPVGTKVKVIDEIHGHQFEIGEIVTLQQSYENFEGWLFKNEKGKTWYLEPKEWEPLPPDSSSIVYTEEEVEELLKKLGQELKEHTDDFAPAYRIGWKEVKYFWEQNKKK